MPKFTHNGETVDATQNGDVWETTFPDGETRLIHASAFGDFFTPVTAKKATKKAAK